MFLYIDFCVRSKVVRNRYYASKQKSILEAETLSKQIWNFSSLFRGVLQSAFHLSTWTISFAFTCALWYTNCQTHKLCKSAQNIPVSCKCIFGFLDSRANFPATGFNRILSAQRITLTKQKRKVNFEKIKKNKGNLKNCLSRFATHFPKYRYHIPQDEIKLQNIEL